LVIPKAQVSYAGFEDNQILFFEILNAQIRFQMVVAEAVSGQEVE